MQKNKPFVEIYTDGACSGNPGIGGFAAILSAKGKEKELYGYKEHTTNNQMELLAVIHALSHLTTSCQVKIYSDSAYVVNGFVQGWIVNWKKNGWKNASKQEVSNQNLWKTLDHLASQHDVEWVKVKGHSDHPYNNRCDALAVRAYKEKICNFKEKIEVPDV